MHYEFNLVKGFAAFFACTFGLQALVTLVLLAFEDLSATDTGAFYAALLGGAGAAYVLSAAEDRPATDARAHSGGARAAVDAIAAKCLSASRTLAVYLAA